MEEWKHFLSALEEAASSPGDQDVVAMAQRINDEIRQASSSNSAGGSGGAAAAATSASSLECPLCVKPCVLPVELPCMHIFCFFCIKGVRLQNSRVSISGSTYQRCPVCQLDIPSELLELPTNMDVNHILAGPSTGYEWYYEARGGGWWQYDNFTSRMIERFYGSGRESCLMFVGGYVYEIDFRRMIQFRQNDPNNSKRAIRRDFPHECFNGFFGLRLHEPAGEGANSSSNNIADNIQ